MPIEIDDEGNKFWLNADGDVDREDGPAIEGFDGSIAWFKNGKFHREDGPAIEYANGSKEFWLNNFYYPCLEEWIEDIDVSLEKKILLKLRYG